jgi:hypothetical protein
LFAYFILAKQNKVSSRRATPGQRSQLKYEKNTSKKNGSYKAAILSEKKRQLRPA